MIAFTVFFVWLASVSAVVAAIEPTVMASDHPTIGVFGVVIVLIIFAHIVGNMAEALSRPGALLIKLSGWLFLAVTLFSPFA